jgi:PAS domain S-box-containing protein
MYKIKLVYRLIPLFFIFALLIVIPLSFMILKQVRLMTAGDAVSLPPGTGPEGYREFLMLLFDQTVPCFLYVLLMAFLFSLFFSRKIIAAAKELQKGVKSVQEGNLDVTLNITSDDELGEAIKAFNEMAAALNKTTLDMLRKEKYINAMLDPLWVLDGDNRIVDVNPSFTRLFGYIREEIIGESVSDFIEDGMITEFSSRKEKTLDNGNSSYEMNMLTKDGSVVPVLVSASPIYSQGEIAGEIGILKDFREQARLRSELQHSRDFLENIMSSIEEEILVIDSNYIIIKANETAIKRSGSPLLGEHCYRAAHDSDRPCWTKDGECPAQTVFLSGRVSRAVHRHITTGGFRFHEIVASPVKEVGGKVVNVIEVIRDITDRVLREEEIKRKNSELVAVNSISGLLSRSLRPDEIFSGLIEKIIEMLGLDGGMIYLLDESSNEFVCRYHQGIPDELAEKERNILLNEDVPGRVAATGRVVMIQDIVNDSRIESSFIRESGIQGYCSVPIKGKGRTLGLFVLFSFTPHSFTPEDEGILNSIGELTGMSVENIRLFEKMMESYEVQRNRRDEEHAQLLSLSARLGAETDLGEIIGSVLDLVRVFFHSDFVWLLGCDSEGNFILKSSSGQTHSNKEVIYDASVISIEKYAIEIEKPFAVSDLGTELNFYSERATAVRDYIAVAAIPMIVGKKPVGVLSLYYSQPQSFRDEELHFLEIIGNFLAVSLERADFYIRAIREKELSNTILQSAADGIITIDTEGRILSFNKSFESLVGFLPVKTLGLPVCNIFRFREGNEKFRLLLGESFGAALEGKTVKREAVLLNISGAEIPVLISSAPILDSEGSVTGVVNILRDISREKEIDRMKTEIIKSVSHEFRTPLSAIVGMTEMIINRDVEVDRAMQYLKVIKQEGSRLSRMVSELLDVARIESGREIMKLTSVEVAPLIRSILDSFESLLVSKEAIVLYEVSDKLTVTGDEEKLKQVLINILDNALTFSDNKCSIDIRVQRKGERVEIKVSDNGWGISPEDFPHITERFYRGRHGDKTRGTGLGLSLCHEIMNMHGGKMEIRSKEGEGTSIILDLPAGEAL